MRLYALSHEELLWSSGYDMHFTMNVAIKEQVQNLEEVDLVFCRALTHKQNLPSNTFC